MLHVVDVSDPRFEEQMAAVDAILASLSLDGVPKLVVFNKIDRLQNGQLGSLCRRYDAVAVSALRREGLDQLVEEADRRLGEKGSEYISPVARVDRDTSL